MQINFKEFKDKVKESLAQKVYKRLEEIYESFSNDIFFEDYTSDFTNDEEYPNNVYHSNVQGPGGEFLVDLKFKDSDTKLKNFRVTAISKEDALSRLNNMFGKKSFEVTKIELEPNYDYKKTDKMLGRVVKESLSMNDSIKTWIDDFIASDDTRFKGKSKEERRQMAIAAYMSKKNELKESKKEDKKAGRKLKGIITDPSYNATDPKNTSSFKNSETVSESCIINKILKNKKENGN